MISGGATLASDHDLEWLFRGMVFQMRVAATSPTNDGGAKAQCIERFLFCARAAGPAPRRWLVPRSQRLPEPGRTSPFGHFNSLLRSQAPLVACRLRLGHDLQRCNEAHGQLQLSRYGARGFSGCAAAQAFYVLKADTSTHGYTDWRQQRRNEFPWSMGVLQTLLRSFSSCASLSPSFVRARARVRSRCSRRRDACVLWTGR